MRKGLRNLRLRCKREIMFDVARLINLQSNKKTIWGFDSSMLLFFQGRIFPGQDVPEFLDPGRSVVRPRCLPLFGRRDDAVGKPHRGHISQFELFELILLLKLDGQFPVDQFEATGSQSTVPFPPLQAGHLRAAAVLGASAGA